MFCMSSTRFKKHNLIEKRGKRLECKSHGPLMVVCGRPRTSLMHGRKQLHAAFRFCPRTNFQAVHFLGSPSFHSRIASRVHKSAWKGDLLEHSSSFFIDFLLPQKGDARIERITRCSQHGWNYSLRMDGWNNAWALAFHLSWPREEFHIRRQETAWTKRDVSQEVHRSRRSNAWWETPMVPASKRGSCTKSPRPTHRSHCSNILELMNECQFQRSSASVTLKLSCVFCKSDVVSIFKAF